MLPRPKVEVMRLRPTSLPSKRNAARMQDRVSGVSPAPLDHVQYTFGRGPIITHGPGPPDTAYRPLEAITVGPGPPYTAYMPLEAIIAGPGPTLKIGPRPKTRWTKSNNTLDQVQYTSGRGPIITPGPGPPFTAYRPLEAITVGPGPTLKIGPRPKTPWTKSKNTLDQVQRL